MVLTLAVSIAQALMTTTLSYFLVKGVHAAALQITLFYAVRSGAEFIGDIATALISDRRSDRRLIIAAAAVASAAAAAIYAVSRDVLVLMTATVVFLSLGAAAFTQIVAYACDYSEADGQEAAVFNSVVRSMVSLAWVVGPPAGMALIAAAGFKPLYGAAAGLFALGALTTFGLKAVPRRWGRPPAAAADPPPLGAVAILLMGLTLIMTAGALCLNGLPLRLTEQGLSIRFVGVFFGASALMEIPLLLAVGRLTGRGRRTLVVTAGALALAAYYLLLSTARQPSVLVALQLLNAAGIAATASLPVLLLQDMLPGRVGLASSLYAGAMRLGALAGGGLLGLILGRLGLERLFDVCTLLALAGAGLLMITQDPAPRPVRMSAHG